jgi:hypothetical protein
VASGVAWTVTKTCPPAPKECKGTSGANAEAYLRGAQLCEADLTSANLSKAYLGEADLRSAKLTKADLTDTNLSEAIMPDGSKHPYQRSIYQEKGHGDNGETSGL